MDNIVHMHTYQFLSRFKIGEQARCTLNGEEVKLIGVEVEFDENYKYDVMFRVRDKFGWEYKLAEWYLEPLKRGEK